MPTVQLAGFGLSVGSLVVWQGCTYPVPTVTIDRTHTSFTANWYQTIAEGSATRRTRTLTQHKALWGDQGYTIGDFKIEPMRTR